MTRQRTTIPEYDGTDPAKALNFLNAGTSNGNDIDLEEEMQKIIAEDAAFKAESASVESAPSKKKAGRKPKSVKEPLSDKAKTSLYISPDTLHDLRVFCADAGIRMTDFVETAIKDRLKAERKKRAKAE